jgi:hypothetical protein
LRRERVACEADRADWALRCGRHHDVLCELATRARTDPWDERVAAQLTRLVGDITCLPTFQGCCIWPR